MQSSPSWSHWILRGLMSIPLLTGSLLPNLRDIRGRVQDARSGEPLLCRMRLPQLHQEGWTQPDGSFRVSLPSSGTVDSLRIQVFCPGYDTLDTVIVIPDLPQDSPGGLPLLVLRVHPLEEALTPVIVRATRYRMPAEEVPVSMGYVSEQEMQGQVLFSPEEAFNTVPGVQVTMRQVSIRGASGWSYGVGSRVLLVLDGLPLYTPEAGDVRWFLVPEMVIRDVEIVKGAASTLYGAGAMDGLIHVYFREPRPEKVHAEAWSRLRIWDAPPVSEWKWWERSPVSRRYGVFLSGGNRAFRGWILAEQMKAFSYRKDEQFDRWRILTRTGYYSPAWRATLTLQYLRSQQQDVFYWLNWDSAYYPFPGSVVFSDLTQVLVDPRIVVPVGPAEFRVAGRWFFTRRNNARHHLSLLDIQVRSGEPLQLTAGVQMMRGYVDTAEFFVEPHEQVGVAPYLLATYHHQRLRVYSGVRFEWNRTDTFEVRAPVFHLGMTWKLGKGTYLRFNAGQGVRVPSVAERYTQFVIGGVPLVPNPYLQEEEGWTLDAGVRQLMEVSRMGIRAIGDLSVFWSEYRNMIEYQFGIVQIPGNPPMVGFRAVNTTDARVTGYELSGGMEWTHPSRPDFHLRLWGGYLHITPLDLNWKPNPADTLSNPYLKYRFRQQVKLNGEVRWKSFGSGFRYQWTSPMLRFDAILVLMIPDLLKVRREPGMNVDRLDMYLGWQGKRVSVRFWVYNVLNRIYVPLPGTVGPPRSYALNFQVRLSRSLPGKSKKFGKL